ncbi:MAG: hypothetical protein A2017_00475 [Lentisphaerae bacterium GWF2_44_16]|nr:MAG: hypothetical protein A2017_00475 [Lentisphaerae bacterium GWF2_44_16]
MFESLFLFINRGIWGMSLDRLPLWKRLSLRLLRILFLSAEKFREDKCKLRASALTFYSLLSLVPVAAMLFGIAKGFGMDAVLKALFLEKFSDHREIIELIISFADKLLLNTAGEMIAGIGVAMLIWTVIMVLSNIEMSFNDIWEIKKSRSIFRKFSDYLSIILICPLLVIMSSSLTVYIATNLKAASDRIDLIKGSFLIFLIIKAMPYIMIWLMFTFIYIFMPNTRIKRTSALAGGLIAGTLFQVLQGVYIVFQLALSKYNIIYGSFSALPLFMIWLHMSWLIVLFGAEIAYAHQYSAYLDFGLRGKNISYSFRKLLMLLVMNLTAKNLSEGRAPLSEDGISRKLGMPRQLLKNILNTLTDAGLLAEIPCKNSPRSCFIPATDIGVLKISNVIDALEKQGDADIAIPHNETYEKLSKCMDGLRKSMKKSSSNMLLKDI